MPDQHRQFHPAAPAHRLPPKPHPRYWWGVLLVACMAIVWFAGIQYRSLSEPDEGRYAEVAREMSASGDWVMPRFNGFAFYDKPPLHYWATTVAYQVFGIHHWTSRLWNALTGLLCILAVWYAGARVWGARQGRLAALICASSLIVVAAGHLNTLDMGVTAFLTIVLAAFLIAEHSMAGPNPAPNSQRRWMLVAWAAMGLAVLSKGLIGVVLPGATLLGYLAWQRDPKLLCRLHLLPGLALLLIPTVPWFVLLAGRDEAFMPFFFIHEHFGRFLSQVANRNQPWWFYLPVVAAGLLPWTGLLGLTLRDAWSRATREQERGTRIVLVWIMVVLVFFSLSGAKLPFYVLPVFPAMALLIGNALPQFKTATVARHMIVMAVLAAILAGLALGLAHLQSIDLHATYLPAARPTAMAAALLAMGTGIAGVLALRGHLGKAIVAAALGGLLFTQGLLFAYQKTAATTSAETVARMARPFIRPDTPVYVVAMFRRGLPFYLGRPVTLVDERPYDLQAGMAWEPQRQIPDLATFEQAWRAHPGAIAFMRPATFRTLSEFRLPMQVVGRTRTVWVVRNPAPLAAVRAERPLRL